MTLQARYAGSGWRRHLRITTKVSGVGTDPELGQLLENALVLSR